MWDELHATPAFEIGTGSTNATGDFDFNASGFFGATVLRADLQQIARNKRTDPQCE